MTSGNHPLLLAAKDDHRPLRLAYVDDDPEACRKLLESWKLHSMVNPIDCYLTGSAFLTALASFVPDIVVLNLTLPDMHGLDVVKAMHGLGPKIPLFVVTCDDATVAETSARETNAVGYALKPVLAPNLLSLFLDKTRTHVRFGLELIQLLDEEAIPSPAL